MTDTPRPLSEHQKMVGTLCALMPHLSGPKRWVRLASELVRAGATAEFIAAVYGEGGRWYSDDWRGQRGQAPNETGIRETVVKWLHQPAEVAPINAMAAALQIVSEARDGNG